jgi:Fe2+ or Zn2+ uptake regulation protein
MGKMKTVDLHRAVKGIGLKATPKRIAILEILAEHSAYLGPEEIWRKLRSRFAKIGLPTVYRNLEELSEGGVIMKIIHPDRKLYYFYCRNDDHHHHFVCLTCRRVQDLDFCCMDEVEKRVHQALKGKIVSHVLQVYGLCQECFSASAEAT